MRFRIKLLPLKEIKKTLKDNTEPYTKLIWLKEMGKLAGTTRVVNSLQLEWRSGQPTAYRDEVLRAFFYAPAWIESIEMTYSIEELTAFIYTQLVELSGIEG